MPEIDDPKNERTGFEIAVTGMAGKPSGMIETWTPAGQSVGLPLDSRFYRI